MTSRCTPSTVGGPALDRSPAEAEPFGQFSAELGLVEVAGGLGVAVEVAGVERGPPAVGPEGEVAGDDVGVEQRVAGA